MSLKQLKKRVERLESKVKHKNSHVPKLPKCLKLLLPVAKHWHNIGIFLEVSETTLEQIEADYDHCSDCVREMIKQWLKQVNPRPTWNALAGAVQAFDSGLVKKIRSMK